MTAADSETQNGTKEQAKENGGEIKTGIFGGIITKVQKTSLDSRKIKIIFAIAFGDLLMGCSYSLMAPFFPKVAESKGATPTEYGLIFGIYHLVTFLTSPIYGKLMPILKAPFLLKAGMLMSGISGILFGTLSMLPPGRSFVVLAFVVRIVDGLGFSAFFTAAFSILGCEFSDTMGRAMSIIESAFSFGLVGGPAIGGVLYKHGGFFAPFATIGILMLLGFALNMYLFRDIDEEPPVKSGSLKAIVKDVDFGIDMVVVLVCLLTLGLNDATLEPHLRMFNLSAEAIGGIFLLGGLTDALSAYFWGYACEKILNIHWLTMISSFLYLITFLIVGPVTFIPFRTDLRVIIISQAILGLGMAGILISTMTHGMKNAVERGFPEDVSTYAIVSGILFSMSCLGGFIGPSLGGFLVDEIGYYHTTEFVVALQIFIILMIAVRLFVQCIKSKKHKNTNEDITLS